jgi:hypothetical protein
MQSNVVASADLVKKMAALRINKSLKKHYHIPPLKFASDTEPDEKGMLYCAYMYLYSLSFSDKHVVKRVTMKKPVSAHVVTETDDENNV